MHFLQFSCNTKNRDSGNWSDGILFCLKEEYVNIKKYFWLQVRNVYRPYLRCVAKRPTPTGFKPLDEVVERGLLDTDISDHLVSLFTEAVAARPKLIVELGVRGGESTFVLERAAALFDAHIVSVDIEDCQKVSAYPRWTFVKQDDIAFARRFEAFCREKGFFPTIDLLFIDTSHLYNHTVQEIKQWFPFLSDKATVIFHDTNMKEVFFRKNGAIRFGWKNDRGVIRAVEEYLGASFNEDKDFVDYRKGWLIKHVAHSSGFTVLERILPS